MKPEHAPGPFDTRPLPTPSADLSAGHETLGGHALVPGSDHTGSERAGMPEDGFVGGFRSEPDPADEPTTADASAEDVLGRPPRARDVTDELAAPPRRRLPALTLALGAGVFATVGFLAGVEVQKDSAEDGGSRASAPNGAQGAAQYGGRAAGGAGAPGGTGQGTGAQPGTGTGTGPAAGVTSGTVKVVDGSFIYVSDSSGNIVKVKTDAGTKIQVTQDGKAVDLTPGDTVVVRGATGEDGSVTATTVTEGTAGAGRTGTGGAPGGQG